MIAGIYWLSSERRKITVAVTVSSTGRIVNAAPVIRVFIGQPIDHLLRWAAPYEWALIAAMNGGAE
jgi:hypothetical protein